MCTPRSYQRGERVRQLAWEFGTFRASNGQIRLFQRRKTTNFLSGCSAGQRGGHRRRQPDQRQHAALAPVQDLHAYQLSDVGTVEHFQ